MESAERIISSLRNAGMAVRTRRPESPADLEAVLDDATTDLVLAALDSRTVPFEQVMALVGRGSRDLPVLALVERLDEEAALNAIAAGAAGVALANRPEHLTAVISQAFAALHARRELRRLEAALRESERRCDALIASSRDPVAYVHEGMHIRANDAYLETFGCGSFEDIEGLPILDLIAPTHAEEFKNLLKRLGKGEPPPRSLDLALRRTDGGSFEATMEFAHANYEGERCLQIVLRHKRVDEELARELDALRQRDPVTGLYNRQHFLQELERAVAEAAGGRSDQAILLLAPDNYDSLLPQIGLDQADALLAAVAARLAEAVPETALAARFSGHEFAVLCRDCPHTDTHALAQRLCEAFRERIIEVGPRSLTLTVSVGAVQIGERIASVPQVLNKVAQCLVSASGVGGNRCDVFDPAASDRAEAERLQAWERRLREALRGDGFVLHYQPIISLKGDPREHYEAFLRLKAGAGEIVKPESFMAIAEERGLMGEIDRWTVGKAIEVLARRRAAGHDTTLFVKISEASLTAPGLADFVTDRLRKTELPGECLVIELREAKVAIQLKPALDLQQALAAVGVRLALEDFGAGLNPLQILEHFEPDFVKIDRSLMLDLAGNPENQAKVRAIAEQAHERGLLGIADYVQDAASMTILFSSGIDYVEGRFLASPGPEMNFDFNQ